MSEAEYAALAEDMTVIVGSSRIFKTLDEAGRAEILELGYVHSFGTDDVLMTQGKPGAVMYLVMNGKVRVETETHAGTIQLAELGRGACVGEVSVITGGVRTATVTAITDVDVVAFAAHRIERVLDHYPKVRDILQKLVESRAQDTIEKIIG